MTAARLTEAEARALGIDTPPTRRKRTTRKEATDGPYWWRCRTCGTEGDTIAGEDRHLRARFESVPPRHARYDTVKELS